MQNLIANICLVVAALLSVSLSAAPLTTYHAVDQRKHSSRYSHPRPYPQQRRGHAVQIHVPHVSVQLNTQTSYQVEETEEVYLPYGGTYRKSTIYQSSPSYYAPYHEPHRRVIQQGQYLIEDE